MTSAEAFIPPSRVHIVEASTSSARAAYLKRWVDAQQSDARAWLLCVDRDHGGPWAGLNDWLGALMPELLRDAPDLVSAHDYELAMVLPTLRRQVPVRNPSLTDLSVGAERTRNYAADRAERAVHGLIDLLTAWHERCGGGRWYLALDGFDRAGTLVRLLFQEWLRRRGDSLPLTLLVAVDPGAGATTAALFPPGLAPTIEALHLSPDHPQVLPAAEYTRRMQALEAQLTDVLDLEAQLPALIRGWDRSDQTERADRYRYQALDTYTTRGLYADAVGYGEALLPTFEQLGVDLALRLNTYNKLYNCYAGLGQPGPALELADRALALSPGPEVALIWHYLLAMLYTRYLPQRDHAMAERSLELGLQEIERAQLSRRDRLFQTAFNRNGLALVRHFQGRRAEAIALCQDAFGTLDAEFEAGEHKLHRSVLLYNIAQVYDAIGEYGEAVVYYGEALAMDPNYSEYYNERGNVHLKTGALELAAEDYARAIALSPPYAEVWTNLGQCQALSGRDDLAVQSYSRALDLRPHQSLALLGRAQSHDALNRWEAALADYSAVLALDGPDPLVLANRAGVLYQLGRAGDALADLDRAIALDPASAELRENRAIALAASVTSVA